MENGSENRIEGKLDADTQSLQPTEIYLEPDRAALALPFTPPQQPDEIGRFGNYRMLKLLGQGGMGHVFLAEDVVLGRRVAVKLMRTELTLVADFKQRFLREARAMAALDHPYIVPIFQIGEEAGTAYLCMPFLTGETLASRLRQTETLSRANVLKLALQLAEGLSVAHRAGLIHRDIKPANIWLTPPGSDPMFQAKTPDDGFRDIRILDFGLVRVDKRGETITGSQDLLGTIEYMSPEQAAQKRIDSRSDLFSMGVVLYQACTGMAPFTRTNPVATIQALATAVPRAPRFFKPEVGMKLSDFIMRLLAKSPDQRPQSADDVVKELTELTRLAELSNKFYAGPANPAQENGADADTVVEDYANTDDSDVEEENDETETNWVVAGLKWSAIGMTLLVVLIAIITNLPNSKLPRQSQTVAATPPPQNPPSESPPIAVASESAIPESPPAPALTETVRAVPSEGTAVPSEATAVPSPGVDRVVVLDIPDTAASENVDASERITLLPGIADGAVFADGGRKLVICLRNSEGDGANEDGLLIYDVPSGKPVKLLRLPTPEFQFAAGGRVLLIYFTDFQRLQAWDIERFEKIAERDFKTEGYVLRMAMGADRGDRAFIRFAKGKKLEELSSTELLEMTTERLEFVKKEDREDRIRSHNTSARDFVHYRSNSDLSLVTEWCTSHSPTGVGVVMRSSQGEFKHLYNHDSESFLAPGVDDLIYSGTGAIFLADSTKRDQYGSDRGELKLVNRIKDMRLIPAEDAALFIGVNSEGEMYLFASGRATPLFSLGSFPVSVKEPTTSGESPKNPFALRSEDYARTLFQLDQRIRLIVGAKALLLLPFSNDRVIRRPFDLKSQVNAKGEDQLLVISAPPRIARWKELWTYQIDAVCNEPDLRYEVVAGPDGIQIDSSGIVQWQVPAGIEGRVTIKIKIVTPTGRELMHRFVVHLVDAG